MAPADIGREIAERSYAALAGLGLKRAAYPAPGSLPPLPALVITWDRVDVDEMNEQINLHRFKGLLFTSEDPLESQIAEIDPLVMPLVDAFSPNLNRDNYRLGGGVSRCAITSAELSIPVVYNGKTYYGGRVWWEVKDRRHAGS